MKSKLLFATMLAVCLHITGMAQPNVYQNSGLDFISSGLNHEALLAFYNQPIPSDRSSWEEYKPQLRAIIKEKTGFQRFPNLPLDYRETGSHQINGITVKNIYFQTRPGIYATANLYIPGGEGPFPGVVTMMGHSSNGRLYDVYQSIGQTLAVNGYVSLHIDPWGSGERSTMHGDPEYHGSNLGASLFNLGESLMGMQITDNIRAVDLLTSLPYVDNQKIAATGASGGGNQTMWLGAMDDRVQVTMPVVSVGTFQSYIMSSNCVCETLVDGLTFTEESSILGLIAPRVLKLCNASKDSNKAFFPDEMKRSFANAMPIFQYYKEGDHLTNQVFNTTHGYHPEMRQAILGLLDLHFKGKGDGMPRAEIPFELLPEEKIMTFSKGQRPTEVLTTEAYSKIKGSEAKSKLMSLTSINQSNKRSELRSVLRLPENQIKNVSRFANQDGWERYSLETSDQQLIPILIKKSGQSSGKFMVFARTEGKSEVEKKEINQALAKGYDVALVDFWGIGEAYSPTATKLNGSYLPDFHTTSRAQLWLGKSIQGIWTQQFHLVGQWLRNEFKAENISINVNRDLGPAAMYCSAVYRDVKEISILEAPISYLFDNREQVDFYSMAIHVPGIIPWGDLSLVAALSNAEIQFEQPKSISGSDQSPSDFENFEKEYLTLKQKLNIQTGSIKRK